ncbi:helix-turn-helix domain-containing protein [Lactobacillus crispatus]|uniref:helix-turn-helix domain-containing protein n=1 Tax=Lactobacillus crispatus TaxID=47770 RepID=UPI0018AAA085|nr:Rgg/GadR/MutR family transcriptional regulator [Lactobacillus crispatus]
MKKQTEKIPKVIGPKFKEFRKKANVSLKELAQKVGITSDSALSRWERGEEGLPVEIFDRVIASLNISYSEIITNEVEVKQINEKVDFLYQKNDTKGLRALATKLLEEYYQETDKFLQTEMLIKSAIVINYYMDLTGIDLSDDEYKLKLTQQFGNIEFWFKKEIILFANVQLLLNSSVVYELSRSLISEMCDKDLVSIDVSIALLNAIFVLIKQKEPEKAQSILNGTKQLQFSSNDLLVKTRIKFMTLLLKYVETAKDYEIRQFFKSLTDVHLRENCELAFLQIKKIYD